MYYVLCNIYVLFSCPAVERLFFFIWGCLEVSHWKNIMTVHQPQASSILHRTWTGDSFHIQYYTCFNAILPNHPTLSMIQWTLAIWSLVPLPLQNPAYSSGSSQFTYCWRLAWMILSINLLASEMSTVVQNILWHWPSLGLEWKLTFPRPVATAEFSKFADILTATL